MEGQGGRGDGVAFKLPLRSEAKKRKTFLLIIWSARSTCALVRCASASASCRLAADCLEVGVGGRGEGGKGWVELGGDGEVERF